MMGKYMENISISAQAVQTIHIEKQNASLSKN
jgi:hypothetical protein